MQKKRPFFWGVWLFSRKIIIKMIIPNSLTPSSNTGSTASNFKQSSLSSPVLSSLDWLQGIVRIPQSGLDFFIRDVASIFRDSFDVDKGRTFCGREFQHHRISDRNSRIAWNFVEGCDCDVLLIFPSKFLSGVDNLSSLRSFLKRLVSLSFRPTRLDLALDDFTKSLTYRHFRNAKDNGHACGYRKHHTILGDSEHSGFTHYMGSTSGDKLYRFYDKATESNGEIDAYRLEAQFKDDWAKSVWSALVDCDDFHQTITDCVFAPLDFYQDGEDSEKIPLQWWSDFKQLCGAGSISINCGRVRPSIERSMEWIESQVETTLATVEAFMDRIGDDFCSWLNRRLESGRSRLSSAHRNRIFSALAVLNIPSHISGEELREGWF
jgi:hypothetical protein